MLSADRKKELKELYKILKIKKQNDELMNEALTHPSYNSERNILNAPNYERLEFLGDSVLRISVSAYIFDKYPDYPEGRLSKIRACLVSDKFLHSLGLKLGLQKYINIGIHEEKCGGRSKESIIACSMEAVMGAIYQSSGFTPAYEYIISLYKDVDIEKEMCNFNAKEILQEYTQGKNKDLPEYKILKESGKEHNKTYEAGVYYNNEILGTGEGKTKKDAEKEAALNALIKLGIAKNE